MRLKHDIQAAHKGLAAVDGLRTVTFRWNDTNKDDYGVIAQEVQKVLPEVIGHRDDGMLSVQYDKLVLPVIEAVKELHAMIVDLEAKVAGLLQWQSDTDKRLDAMQAEIQALKAANDNLAHQNDELRKLVTGAQKK
ncbi:MAG: tail fiber domain-containing protein [Alphaproteobacteria bacterium]|nr:tail fiber domain-containing protein [Alphaproteobacteria bacterium]